MNVHSPNAPATAPGSRAERRWRTRRALLDAALELQEDGGFASLSMSGVARRAGIVPSAFYRHFAGMEELGVALIDESFGTLRTMLSAARADPRTYEHVVGRSVEILARYVREHRAHFRFIGRERSGGVAVLRDAIRREIRAFASDLATDLARFPDLAHWSSEDLRLLAGIFVNVMVFTAEAILDAPHEDRAAQDAMAARGRRELLMVILGVPAWRGSDRRATG